MMHFFKVKPFRYLGQSLRLYSAIPIKDVKTKKQVKVSNSNIKKCPKEMLDYFEKSETFNSNREMLPYKLLCKKPKQPENLYLMDERVAAAIVDCIKDDVLSNGAPVFECCPGFGLVTKELLKSGVNFVRLFDLDPIFKPQALKLEQEYEGRVNYCPKSILQLWKIAFQDLLDNGTRLSSLMDGIVAKSWEDPPVLNMFGVLSSSSFLRHIVFSIIFKGGILTYGRPELYFLLSPNVFLQLQQDRDCGKYQNRTFITLCSILFDCHLYGTFDRSAFIPWQTPSAKLEKMCKIYNLDHTKLYLTKITPKRDLYTIISPENIKLLWFFLKCHLSNRSNRLIPALEQWIPGCGIRIIAMGYGVFTHFSELSSQEILHLFLNFVSWPEFPSCSFVHAMETTMVKMQTPSDLEIITDELKPDDEQSIPVEDKTD